MRLFFSVLLALFFCEISYSQHKIQGTVAESETGSPLAFVLITDVKTSKWTLSDEAGNFSIPVPKQENVVLSFKILGRQEQIITVSASQFTKSLLVAMELSNLRLNEVVISAKKGKNFSEITLGREAVNQVQAFTLNDVLEQLPGQSVTNFNLSEFKPIVFRTVKPVTIGDNAFGNKSFGTAVVVDGIPMSNNENMQSYVGNSPAPFSPNFIGFGDGSSRFNGYFSNANFGTDLREIQTDNIEKIEVVQGIPSAKYGDLTSGLIKIEQKAGRSPFKIFASLRDGASEYGFTKGFRLGERAGALNVSFNYLESNISPRTSFSSYERINTNVMWSWNNKNKNIRNSMSFTYGFNNDDVNHEEEDNDNKIVKNKKKDFGFTDRFKWNFSETSFFDNLDVNFNLNYGDHFTYESKFTNIGGTIVATSLHEGVYTGTYTPVSYTAVKAIEGIPVSSFLSADLFKTFTIGNWSHNTAIGTSFNMSDNKGRGRLGSPETMISYFANDGGEGSEGFRPYNYGENVRAEYQFSLYAEDNIIRKWDNSTLNISTGVRYDNQYGFSNVAPRINAFYSQDKIKFRGGFGLTSKAPSLNQLYTGPRYYDVVLGDYRLPGFYNLGIVQTFIDYSDNKDLKPSKSLRTEVGFDYKFPFAELNITGFYNNLYDGTTSEQFATKRDIAQLDITYHGNQVPTYTVSGYAPYYFAQNKLVNKYLSTDKGIEFFLNFPKLPLRNFKLDLQGSYIETKNTDNTESLYRSEIPTRPEIFGVYKPYDEYYRMFKMGGNLNYHLAKIGLVISVRSEHLFINEDTDNNRNRPYAYLDADFNKVLIPAADQTNQALYGHIIGFSGGIDNKIDKVYHNFHLRLSKDFLNGFRFSFYSNNFLDLKTTGMELENGVYVKKVSSQMVRLSFGTKIEYQF